MKIALTGTAVLALAGIAALGVGVYVAKKRGVPDAVNPFSADNLVNRAATSVLDAVVPDSPGAPGRNADGSITWGGFLYDINPFEDHAVRDLDASPQDMRDAGRKTLEPSVIVNGQTYTWGY